MRHCRAANASERSLKAAVGSRLLDDDPAPKASRCSGLSATSDTPLTGVRGSVGVMGCRVAYTLPGRSAYWVRGSIGWAEVQP
jgi:hypothetical protein